MAIGTWTTAVATSGTTTTTHTISRPGGVVSGDVAYVGVAWDVIGTSFTPPNAPTGWTRIGGTGQNDPWLYVYRRVCNNTSTDNFSVTTGTAYRSSRIWASAPGIDTATDDTALAAAKLTSPATSASHSGITVVTTGATVLMWNAIDASGTADISQPAGMTTTQIATAGRRQELSLATGASAGATGSKSITWDGLSHYWVGAMVAAKPAGAAPPPVTNPSLGTSSPIVVGPLSTGMTYTPRVRARNTAGWGDWASGTPIVNGFKMPFPGGQVWDVFTYDGHGYLDRATDWNRANDVDDPVLAGVSGTATIPAFNGSGLGNAVYINVGNGWQTRYGHFATITFTEGQIVTPLTQIGTVGTTGNSTGPHLHYEQILNGTLQPVTFDGNPITYVYSPDFVSYTSTNY